MIVYCVFDTFSNTDELDAIFSTEEKAVDYIESMQNAQSYYVIEWEVE